MAWTSPRTWVAGEKPTAATLNTHIRDNFKAIGDPWTTYSPTVTNVTLGTGGTTDARYIQAGKWVTGDVLITLGTSGALTGTAAVTLPATPRRSAIEHFSFGTCSLFDTSASAIILGAARWTSTIASGSLIFSWNNSGVTTVVNAAAATPWTWAVGDRLYAQFAYEAA